MDYTRKPGLGCQSREIPHLLWVDYPSHCSLNPSNETIAVRPETPAQHAFLKVFGVATRYRNSSLTAQPRPKQKKFIHLTLAERFLAYAIGRHTDVLGRNEIETILKQPGTNIGFRDLVTRTVLSDTFRRAYRESRNSPPDSIANFFKNSRVKPSTAKPIVLRLRCRNRFRCRISVRIAW